MDRFDRIAAQICTTLISNNSTMKRNGKIDIQNLPSSPINSGAWEFSEEMRKELIDAIGYAPSYIESSSFVPSKYYELMHKLQGGGEWNDMSFFDMMMNGWGDELFDLYYNGKTIPEVMSFLGKDVTNENWIKKQHLRTFLRAKNPNGNASVEEFKNEWRDKVFEWADMEKSKNDERRRKRETAKLYKNIRFLKTDIELLKNIVMASDASTEERERLLASLNG